MAGAAARSKAPLRLRASGGAWYPGGPVKLDLEDE